MLNTLFKLLSYRKEQLELQEKHDMELKKVFKTCPLIAFNILLLERKINRNQVINSNNNNIFYFYQNISNNLDIVNKYQIELDTILNNGNVCSNLDNFIKKYNNIN